MNINAIQRFRQEYDEYLSLSKGNELQVRPATERLIRTYAEPKKLILINEYGFKAKGFSNSVDGALIDKLRFPYGYWEAKDSKDNLENEIIAKFKRGYPDDNIYFEDGKKGVLFVAGKREMEIDISDDDQLHKIITLLVSYERGAVLEFREAIKVFNTQLPNILETLRKMIEKAHIENEAFQRTHNSTLELCQSIIHKTLTGADVDEMLMQHVLSEDIFKRIFDDDQYHDENNVAKLMREMENTFLKGDVKRNLVQNVAVYYNTIKAHASQVDNHDEKQKILKAVYEEFYKAYNPKAADRLGVVYTPNEIVKFMIKATDELLGKYFSKQLASSGVEILDPCTGTGTFITDLIEFLPKNKLAHKYKNEIHANELGLLPYYIANLNIEYTYRAKMGEYVEFKHICLVDTLDNTGATSYFGKELSLFHHSVAENALRVKVQNERKISVIIGNPPYNARQANFNMRNPNRPYADVDKRIKDTYIKQGTAQNQIVVYDMYVRFIRWASDRIDDEGMISFITNSSYIDSRAFNGVRKCISQEFDYAYIIDLGGDIRKLSGKDGIWMNEDNTIFGIAAAVGISIIFLIRKKGKSKTKEPCEIHYIHPCDIRATRLEKFQWIESLERFNEIEFERIFPDENYNWLNLTENDWEELIPICDKDVKAGKSKCAIFELFSLGIATHRDKWNYDYSKESLEDKVNFMIQDYENCRINKTDSENVFWDSDLTRYLKRGIQKKFEIENFYISSFRPFVKKYFFYDKHFNGRTYGWSQIKNSIKTNNLTISVNTLGNKNLFHCLMTDEIVDLHFTGDSQCLPLYRYASDGERIDNITDWGLNQFREKYANNEISKDDIFYYVYGVLHCPDYRAKYEQNLKRDFPRIPFQDDFWSWSKKGRKLADLHINFETIEPYPLIRNDKEFKNENLLPVAKLKADKEKGEIIIDTQTTLSGIPPEAWTYKLGNRSALEWILDQYKESTPSDPTIKEKFNTYRFSDYKEKVIDLLMRVCRVSVETVGEIGG